MAFVVVIINVGCGEMVTRLIVAQVIAGSSPVGQPISIKEKMYEEKTSIIQYRIYC
jgi:hypothetical protein